LDDGRVIECGDKGVYKKKKRSDLFFTIVNQEIIPGNMK